jgi:hypothetical protein
MATGTHPTAHWSEQRLSDAPRYQRLHDRYAVLALQQLIAGQHVHVSVDDPELAVAIIDRLRPDLPLLVALAGSSPFWEGVDTGHDSYRTMWFSRFPVAGSQELLGSRGSTTGSWPTWWPPGWSTTRAGSTGTLDRPCCTRPSRSASPTPPPAWTTPSCRPG